jgi:hypothetical protein
LDFYAVLDQIVEIVRRRGRVSYQALKVTFELDDERFAALRASASVDSQTATFIRS